MHSLVDASTDREILLNGLLMVIDWDTQGGRLYTPGSLKRDL